jgi:hypothetical protein
VLVLTATIQTSASKKIEAFAKGLSAPRNPLIRTTCDVQFATPATTCPKQAGYLAILRSAFHHTLFWRSCRSAGLIKLKPNKDEWMDCLHETPGSAVAECAQMQRQFFCR